MVVKIDPEIQPQANPFYSKVMLGIEDACRRKGINLLFATLLVDENNRPAEIPQMLSNRLVDGFILVGTLLDDSFIATTSELSPRIVLVDGYSEGDRYDSVVSDNFRAAYQAVKLLVDQGHRHIGLVGGTEACFPSLKDRRNGYLRALKENYADGVYVADFNINTGHGYEESMTLLKEYPHITALFCINDDVGSAAIKAVQALGRRVPADVSVIGFDDTYIAANSHPPLTTLHVDTLAMGRAAVHLLSLRMEAPESARMTLVIHPTLVERQSISFPRSTRR
jgi:LacI family transcriptional regulator